MNIKLKPIAESKIRQMGGDVCGVLVRKDDKLAAVDEHGRVQWLQSGQGADPIGSPGSLQRAKAVFAAYREDFPRFGKRLDGTPAINDLPVRVTKAFSDLCPQPAQQGSVPEAMTALVAICQHLRDHVDNRGTSIVCDRGVNHFLDALKKAEEVTERALSTTPQPEADGWVKCSERLPKLGQRVQLFSQGVIQHMMPLFDDSDEGLFWDFEVHDYNPPVDMSRDQWRPLPQPPQEDV